MSEESIQNPHDQLFKETFSHVEDAAVFFQNYLPTETRARLDWDTLRLQPGKYTDETLRGSESDLLYTVQIDQSPALLYCLFEHQSIPDTWLPMRLLRYILGIWQQIRNQNPGCTELPPVLPLVLYQGGATWKADLSLSGFVDCTDGLKQYQPTLEYLLVDLSNTNTDDLQGSLIGRTLLMALKASRQGSHTELLRMITLLAEYMHPQFKLDLIRAILWYICTVDNNTDFNEYINQVEALKQPKLQAEVMTIAEQLRKDGRQEGRQEGVRQGVAKALLKILNKRFGSVSHTIEGQISAATTTQLEAWIDAALDAESIQQLFNA